MSAIRKFKLISVTLITSAGCTIETLVNFFLYVTKPLLFVIFTSIKAFIYRQVPTVPLKKSNKRLVSNKRLSRMTRMVWYGVVWYGIWYSIVWHGMAILWYGMVGCGVVWYGMNTLP